MEASTVTADTLLALNIGQLLALVWFVWKVSAKFQTFSDAAKPMQVAIERLTAAVEKLEGALHGLHTRVTVLEDRHHRATGEK